jgi:RecB family endonuclease NucS
MSTGIIEELYYKLYSAVLLGNIDNSRMYLDLLRDEYATCEKDFEILNNGRFDHLQQLSIAVEKGLTVKNFNYTDDNVDTVNKDDDKFITEKELVIRICQGDELKKLLKASDDFYIYNLEHPVKYGKIDIVAQDNLTTYIIETKKSHARYSVISQIEKYLLEFKLKLNLKHYDKVIGIVIANGYIGNVAKELVKIGVIPVKYTIKKDNLRFRKLHGKEEENNNT